MLISEVDGNFLVKVTDFGMSRNTVNSDYYSASSGAVPIRWTAPEAVKKAQYSTSSDVWSFGVTCWEVIFSCLSH